MRKFTALASTAIIAAGTGWISFGQPSYLHAQENAEVNIEVDKNATNKEGTRAKEVPAGALQQSGQNQNQNQNQMGQGQGQQQMQDQQKQMNDQQKQAMQGQASAPQQLLAKATHASVSPDMGITKVLSSADQERITGANADSSQLDQTASQLRTAWQEKYGSELSVDSIAAALNQQGGGQLNAQAGGQTGNMTASGNMSQPAGGATSGGQASDQNPIEAQNVTIGSENRAAPRVSATPPGAGDPADRVAVAPGSGAEGVPESSPAADGVQRNSDSPRLEEVATGDANAQTASGQMQPAGGGNMSGNTATYTVPASNGMPATTLNLVKEGGEWKVDIADSIDAKTLHNNLNTQLSQVANMKDQWPEQEAQAQRILAHHVAMALSQGSANSGNMNQ
ncbi:MAG TPA: hypothetical protein VGN72_12110 [Tepidisphaeraceae bacterium]|jgi:hypothetical protein|nr:hypothetical protein [Tepidisphaeraceae bacterium]